MNGVEAALRRIVTDLGALELPFALVGGFAVSARAEPRFTRDVDLAVAVGSDPEAEAVVHALVAQGYAALALVEQYEAGRLATVRLTGPGPSTSPVVLDLLFASAGIEPEVAAAAERLEILPGLIVPVAIAAHLVVLKLLARDDTDRPQDAADLRALGAVLAPRDHEEARAAAALVVERGFDRGRDLVGLLEAYLRTYGGT